MAETTQPIIKLDDKGTASVISYNVPEPTSYTGRNFIELSLGNDFFLPKATQKPVEPKPDASGGKKVGGFTVSQKRLTPTATEAPVVKKVETATVALPKDEARVTATRGLATEALTAKASPAMALSKGKLQVNWAEAGESAYRVEANAPVSKSLVQLTPETVTSMQSQGKVPAIYRNLYGTYDVAFVPQPTEAKPRIVLVETYRLSSYLGRYGAGRTIKTFSLFPGERATISVKTYKKTETEAQSASSILDSFTETSATEFENSVAVEQSDKETYEKSRNYSVEAEAHASWGWGGASVSGSYSGASQSAREEFAKNVSSATSKHAATASAKRDVQIETSYQVKEEAGEETSIAREFQNINVSRTLNFVFRQMNQEFITVLHLVDVRVAFFNGFPESTREVALSQLDSLLEEFVVEAKRAEVKTRIVGELSNVFNYRDEAQSFIEKRTLAGVKPFDYYRVKKDTFSTYKDEVTGTTIKVPGVILAANNYVLRTDGIIVEALLGQATSLDDYSSSLQEQAIRAKQLENDLLALEIERARAGLDIVKTKNAEAAQVFATVFPAQANGSQDGDE
ncbi:MAG TPA: hypothetical protein VGB73_20555 [Pyrinomonadaceae bacterium]|jgi:hypothetical protein